MVRQTAKKSRPCPGVIQAVLIAVLLGVAAQGAEVKKEVPRKPAWKWTLDERLAARFDPKAMAAREAEQEAAAAHARELFPDLLAEDEAPMKEPAAASETIDGSKTPEFFLPLELFSALLSRGFPSEGEEEILQESRRQIEQRGAALGFGRDLWTRLEKVTSSYLRLLHEGERRNRITRNNDSGEKQSIRLCRLRLQAMEAAKAEFGEEAFLRLLYEAVAPNVQRTYVLKPGQASGLEAQLRSQEGGCR